MGTSGVTGGFKVDFAYQEQYLPQVIAILKANATALIAIEVADPDSDMQRATDLNITISSGSVAVRIRRASQSHYRDLTIRAYKNGNKTELHKLREGYAKWYLYAWEDTQGQLAEWMLVDIDKMREAELFSENRPIKMNKDGYTGFIAYSIGELSKANAIIAKRIAA